MQNRSAVIGLAFLLVGCGGVPATSPPGRLTLPPPPTPTPAPSEFLARTSAPGDSVIVLDASTGKTLAVLSVGRDPKLLGVGGGHVWTLDLGDGTLTRIGAASRMATTVRVAGEAVGMALADGHVYVTHDERRLTALAADTGDARLSIDLDDRPLFARRNAGFLAVDAGTAWITIPDLEHSSAPHALWEVDLESGATRSIEPLAPNPLTPIIAFDAAWVPQPTRDSVLRLDLETRSATSVPLSGTARLAAAEGSVWACLEPGAEIVRLDPQGRVLATIPLSARGRGIGSGGGLIWATTEVGVAAIDPGTNQVVREIPLMARIRHGQGPTEVAWFDGELWVAIE